MMPCRWSLAALSLRWLMLLGCSLFPTSASAQSVTHKQIELDVQGTRWFRTSPASHSVPDGAPSLAVHATDDAKTAKAVHLVIYLHGWRGCTRVLMARAPVACREGEAVQEPFVLRAAVEESGLAVVLALPQLSFWKRSGAPGRFRDAAFVGAWLRSVVELEELRDKRIVSTTLVAHSAGFEAALVMLDGAPESVDNVVMLDALYDGGTRLVEWLLGAPERRALSLTLGRGKTWKQSRLVERLVRRRLGETAVGQRSLDEWKPGVRFKRVQASSKHRDIPREQLADVLRLLQAPR